MAGGLLVKVDLDWSKPHHYDPDVALPCRICRTDTHMRDGQAEACHVKCAEDEIARELIGAGERLINDERFTTTTKEGRR